VQKVPYSDTENAICDQYKVDLLDDLRADRKNQLVVVASYPKFEILGFMMVSENITVGDEIGLDYLTL